MDASIKVDGIEAMFASVMLETEQVKENFVKVLWDELMENTPVDSGTARASWDIAESMAGIKSIGYGMHKLPSMPNIQEGNVVISSKLDYMVFLNEGWSAQAPALFIEQAVAIAYSEVK